MGQSVPLFPPLFLKKIFKLFGATGLGGLLLSLCCVINIFGGYWGIHSGILYVLDEGNNSVWPYVRHQVNPKNSRKRTLWPKRVVDWNSSLFQEPKLFSGNRNLSQKVTSSDNLITHRYLKTLDCSDIWGMCRPLRNKRHLLRSEFESKKVFRKYQNS